MTNYPCVFISHSSKDKGIVLRFAEALRDAGISYWLDLDLSIAFSCLAAEGENDERKRQRDKDMRCVHQLQPQEPRRRIVDQGRDHMEVSK